MPDEFAYRYMKGPGYMAVVAGEVVHIIECIPKELKIRKTNECYNRLPIMQGNETAYLTPRTHIVVTQATQIPCNSPLLQYYRLGSTWFKMLPQPVETLPPAEIKPHGKITWKYHNPQHLATSGIDTESDLEKMRDRIMFPMENTAVLNKIAQRVSGNGTQYASPSMFNLFDENALEKLAENAWERTWGRFIKFGAISAGFIGIFMVIRICKLLVDTIIHGYTLHLVYGWSIHLLGAIWDSVTHLLLHLARSRRNYTRAEDRDIKLAKIPSASAELTDPIYPQCELTTEESGQETLTKDNFVKKKKKKKPITALLSLLHSNYRFSTADIKVRPINTLNRKLIRL
ncbi:uncharacterized protein LOC135163949 [Diachasmimorpha longicaudata]|uniref:uncharacterized protein LOC135163949 n=1 Tax=Diachasmimorpha longicaudata TaxID=58733 RepID=UPI0030B8C489